MRKQIEENRCGGTGEPAEVEAKWEKGNKKHAEKQRNI